MCQDCGCEEGMARRYFARGDHAHPHVHVHGASDGALPEIHVHVHLGGPDHSHGHDHGHDHGHTHEGPHEHAHPHEHEHEHGHDHDHPGVDAPAARTVRVESRVLARNDEAAAKNRGWLRARGVRTVNLISSPGSGKTALLERTLDALTARGVKVAVIVGDQQTDNDARRLEGRGARVVQIETHASCHLNAEQIGRELEAVVAEGVTLLIIENVGNLVCPAAFDLGEDRKVALLSVTEGEDKPLKYPVLFSDAPLAVITKTDLLPHLDVDIDACERNVRAVRPDAKILKTSAKTGEGIGAWIDALLGDHPL
jgi:hydrogenase nickel incorporation protein HypB